MRMGLRWILTWVLRKDTPAEFQSVWIELNYCIFAVEVYMHLVRIHSRHHMGCGVADGDIPNHATGDAIEGRQLVAEPLGM